MGISKLLKATLLATILLSPLAAEEVDSATKKCEAAYDVCVSKCNDSEKCTDKCDEKYEECTDSSEETTKDAD